MAAKKPIPQLNQTAEILHFVETGRTSAQDPGNPETQAPSATRVREVVQSGERETAFEAELDPIQRARQKRKSHVDRDSMLTKRTYEIPDALGRRLKVIASAEGVNVSEIVANVLGRWVGQYDRGEI